jgi:hypothetical protein
MPPTADTVGQLLADKATRLATLDALEAHTGAFENELRASASRALGGLLEVDEADVDEPTLRRMLLLLARFFDEASDETELFAELVEGRGGLERLFTPPAVVRRYLQGPAAELGRDAAITYACYAGPFNPVNNGVSPDKMRDRLGLSGVGAFMQTMMSQMPLSNANMPRMDVPLRLATVLLELLRDPPEQRDPGVVRGAWAGLQHCVLGRPAVSRHLYKLGAFDTMAACLNATGSGAEWMTPQHTTLAFVPFVATEILRAHAGEPVRPDKADFVSVGLFERFVDAVIARAEAGEAGLAETTTVALLMTLAGLTICIGEPGCDAKLRSAGGALSFHVNHSLVAVEEFGLSTGAYSAELCAKLFGRDEVDSSSSFTFQQTHIDGLLTKYADMVAARGWWANFKPTADTIHTLNLCISDANKSLLLRSPGFFEYLTSGLMLDPDHPRQNLTDEEKRWVQETHAECFAQVAMFAPGRAALLGEGDAIAALEEVSERCEKRLYFVPFASQNEHFTKTGSGET